MSLRSMEQLFLEKPLYRCFLLNDHLPYFQQLLQKKFPWSIFLVSSFIENFIFVPFQQEMKQKKGNTQMELKYLLFCWNIGLLDVKEINLERNIQTIIWLGNVFKDNLML